MGSKSKHTSEVCVIIGAASGMGEACARRFVDRDILLLADINPTRLDAVVKELANKGAKVESAVCDVTNRQAVASLASQAASLGRVRVIVNTAGISPAMTNDWRRVLLIDLVGTALILEAFLPLAGPSTSVVCIASTAAFFAPAEPEIDAILDEPLHPDFLEHIEPTVERLAPGFAIESIVERLGTGILYSGAAYFLAKRGVIRLCKRQTSAWAACGARLNSISPGVIHTPMGEIEMEKEPEAMNFQIEMSIGKRSGTPEEVAVTVDFLCSDEASFITGVDLPVDGGVLAAMQS